MGLLSGLTNLLGGGGGGGGGGTSTGGFFGSGGKTSTSISNAATATEQDTVSDNQGAAIAGSGSNNVINFGDYNAIGLANDLAQSAIDASNELGRGAQSLSLQTSQSVIDFTGGALLDSLQFAGKFGDSAFSTVEKALGQVSGAYSDAAQYNAKALTAVSDASANAVDQVTGAYLDASAYASKALAAVENTNENALDTVSNLFKSAFQGVTDFVGNLQEKAQSQLGETVTALNEIATENSKSTDQRVAEISSNAIRYVIIGVGILVVGGGLVAAAVSYNRSR